VTVKTLADLTAATGLPVDLHLVLDLTVPVADGMQAQGDLIVVPLAELADRVAIRDNATWSDVPADGVEVVRNEAGGNPHTLVADPDMCLWTTDVDDLDGLAVGVLDAMEPVYLLHREHGGTGIAPGRYVVRRQRELIPPVVAPRRVLADDQDRAMPRALRPPVREAPSVWRSVVD
jgi:hypothetical protein